MEFLFWNFRTKGLLRGFSENTFSLLNINLEGNWLATLSYIQHRKSSILFSRTFFFLLYMACECDGFARQSSKLLDKVRFLGRLLDW